MYLDMTDPSTDCPAGWKLTGYSKRTCHSLSDGQASCDSAFFPVGGGPYRQVCGKIRAYQWHSPAAFTLSDIRNTPDDPYFDGVAVLHGQRPRQHIWTFAAGTPENATNHGISSICPCDIGASYAQPPALFLRVWVRKPWILRSRCNKPIPLQRHTMGWGGLPPYQYMLLTTQSSVLH